MSLSASEARASINFMRNRTDGGIFSASNPSITRMDFAPVDLELRNMRELDRMPSLEEEGFTLVNHELDGDWTDRTWLDAQFVPDCLQLVKRLTGAHVALNMYFPIQRSSQPSAGASPPANFLHIDQTREIYTPQAREKAAGHGYELGRKAAIYNVWKAVSPPPQAMPLAMCDQRAIPTSEHVVGMTIEGSKHTPHVGMAVPDAPFPLYYVPDMQIDESLVFLAVNLVEGSNLGVPHVAIVPPGGNHGLPERRSVELRVLALFD